MDKAQILALADRVEAECSNEVDVLAEIALHQPQAPWDTIRANAAGTKVIYGQQDGTEKTYWARDWTLSPKARSVTAASLRAMVGGEDGNV